MQWDKLRTFYYVAKYKSFTRTGQELNISQSAISRQVIDLEYQVGHKLFKRLPRGLALTQQGELLYQYTEKMFVYSVAALSHIQNEQSNPQGELRLGANIGLVDTWLCEILPVFMLQYPDINLSLYSKDKSLDVEALEVDVALQPYISDQPELVQNLLMRWNRRLYASEEYVQKYGMPKSCKDLKNHRLISFGTETIHLFDNINWHLALSGQKGDVQKPYASANSLRALYEFAKAGLGIIPFSKESPLLRGSNLAQILPEIHGPSIDIYFTYPIQLKGIRKVEVLEEYLKEHVLNHHNK